MERSDHRKIWKYIKSFDNIKEGLIVSWSNDEFIKSLKQILKSNNIDKFDIYSDEEHLSIILNVFKYENSLIDDIKSLLNRSGYYSILKPIDSYKNSIDFDFEFGKKFNIESKKEDYLYHVTHPQFLSKIIKNGLIPKSKKLIENHPDRIYLTDNIKDAVLFAESKYKTTNNPDYKNYVILRIKSSDIQDIKLYKDALAIDGAKMFYVLDNISPKFIEVLIKDSL